MNNKVELLRSITNHKFQNNIENMKEELMAGFSYKDEMKDVLIVVKDQYNYVKVCIESLYENTDNFNLFLWDNNSDKETADYLLSVVENNTNVYLHISEKNEGFLEPNNRLAEKTTSPYIILLNSDTEVKKGWDKTMLGWLELNKDTLLVGYGGCCLDESFKGGYVAFGNDIDYIAGWSVCFSRETYSRFGLFDELNLKFAYCEDADFSLRIKEAGYKIYAINLELIEHYENKTMRKVLQDENFHLFFKKCFNDNHLYMKNRWYGKNVVLHEITQSEISSSQNTISVV
jgi:GT2 family glycosyltransferase